MARPSCIRSCSRPISRKVHPPAPSDPPPSPVSTPISSRLRKRNVLRFTCPCARGVPRSRTISCSVDGVVRSSVPPCCAGVSSWVTFHPFFSHLPSLLLLPPSPPPRPPVCCLLCPSLQPIIISSLFPSRTPRRYTGPRSFSVWCARIRSCCVQAGVSAVLLVSPSCMCLCVCFPFFPSLFLLTHPHGMDVPLLRSSPAEDSARRTQPAGVWEV